MDPSGRPGHQIFDKKSRNDLDDYRLELFYFHRRDAYATVFTGETPMPQLSQRDAYATCHMPH